MIYMCDLYLGSQFWNELTISPVGGGDKARHFIAVQSDVTAARQRMLLYELRERALNFSKCLGVCVWCAVL